MKKIFSAMLALSALAAGPAMAADMAVKAPVYKAPPPAPIYNWTGFYIGGSLGGLWGTYDGSFVFPPPATFSSSQSTGIADAHWGFQFQFGPGIVLGVEGNFIGLFNNSVGTDTCHPVTACNPIGGATLAARFVDNIWTVGGRGGLALGAWMPYISGGYASTRFDHTFLAFGVPFETTRTRHDGAYIGGGVDWQIWSNGAGALVAGFEYRHYEFQTVRAVPIIVATGVPNPADTWDLRPRADTVEARLSWLFNFGGPVYAKY